MDCVNHPGVNTTAFCQNCGKGLCAACVRREAGGQILCEPCWAAWQAVRPPFVPMHPGGPNPGVAAALGLIPGVGAMYNGQFFKGLIHVVIFALLVSMANYYGIFGIFIAAWIFYQSFEAYHTARARREGDPVPDPLGLNELGNWFQTGFQSEYRRTHPHQGAPGAYQPPYQGPYQEPYQEPYQAPYQAPYQGQSQGPQPNPYQSGYQPPPFTPPYGAPAPGFAPGFAPPPPASGFAAGAPPIPPVPQVPPVHWRRREPIAAIVLIAMGLLFLLGQVSGRVLEFTWPVLLIGLGAWLIVRRTQDSGPLTAPPALHVEAPQTSAPEESQQDSHGGEQ